MRVFLQTLTVLGIVAVGLIVPGPSFTQQTGRAPAGPVDPAPAPADPAIPSAVFTPPGEGTTGTWLITGVVNAPWVLLMEQKGANVTGTIRQTMPPGGRLDLEQAATLLKGIVKDKTIKFNITATLLSPVPIEMTFDGAIKGETITFSRTGGNPGGAGLFGDGGARQFTATRQANPNAGAALLPPRQTPTPASCNQPMPDAITHVKIPQGSPSHTTASRDGCWLFVVLFPGAATGAVAPGGMNGLAVLRRNAGRVEAVRFLPLKQRAPGESSVITNDGKALIIAAEEAVVFFDIEKLVSGQDDPILARVGDQRFSLTLSGAVTSDGSRLFVPQNGTDWVTRVNVTNAGGVFHPTIEGGFPAESGPHTAVLSPDERYLYIPSNAGTDSNWPLVCNSGRGREGAIQVIDVQRARSNAASPVVATIKAGCSTRRVVVSPDGNTFYATAAEDNALLAFDARPLRSGAPPTLIAKVPVGSTPVGLALTDGGKKIVVSNSNYLGASKNDITTLTVIAAARIAEGNSAVIGTIPAGSDPRNISVTPDGRTLLVSNHGSGTLEIVDLMRVKLDPVKNQQAFQPAATIAVNPVPAAPLAAAIPPAVFIPPGEGTTGTWLITDVANAPWILLMEQKGANVTGTIRQTMPPGERPDLAQPAPLLEGVVKDKTLKFKITTATRSSPAVPIEMTFDGAMNGETITFSRTGGRPGGGALFGDGGARQFTATRQVSPNGGAASMAPRQVATTPENCNQPMPDAITRVAIAGYASQPILTRDGCWMFVGLGGGGAAVPPFGVAVLHRNGAAFEQIRFAAIDMGGGNGRLPDLVLTHDEKTLIASMSSGRVDLLDVGKLISGQGDALIGSLKDAHFGFTATMAVTFDDKHLFVSQRSTAWISIVDLDKARAGQFAAAIAGGIPVTGESLFIHALSPDQRYLYVSTQIEGTPAAPECRGIPDRRPLEIQVIDVERALSHPESSVIARVPAGCGLGRGVTISSDSNTLYAIADGDTTLRTFDMRPLRDGSPPKLVGKFPMGAGSGLALVDNGKKVIVSATAQGSAAERRNVNTDQPQVLMVLDTGKLSSGADAVLTTVSVGNGIGRSALTPDGRAILVASGTARTVAIVDWPRLLREQAKSTP